MARKILSIPSREARRQIQRSRSSWLEQFEDRQGSWYLKTYRYQGLRAALRGAFRNTFAAPSRVRREQRALERLFAQGVQADFEPRIREKRCLRLLFGGFLLEAQLQTRNFGGSDLARLLREDPPDAGLALDEWAQLGQFVRQLHDAGLHDPDLKARNILVRRESVASDKTLSFAKIDASSSSLCRPGALRDVARRRNLAVLRSDLEACGAAPEAIASCLSAACRARA